MTSQSEGLGTFSKAESEKEADGTELFEEIPKHTDFVSGREQIYYPLYDVNTGAQFEYVIDTSGDEYVDLSMIRLVGQAQLVKADTNAALTETDACKTTVCCNFPSTMFKSLEIILNNVKVSDNITSMYAYKAYLETLLSFGFDAKKTHLTAGFWYPDKASIMDSSSVTNTGWGHRDKLTKNGKKFDFSTLLFSDFFHTTKLLPNGCKMKLVITKHDPSFYLHGDTADAGKYKAKFLHLCLYVRKIKMSPQLLKFNNAKLESGKFGVIPITRSNVREYTMIAGTMNDIRPIIIHDKIPRTILIGILDQENYAGTITKSPFNFTHQNVSSVHVLVNGVKFPTYPYEPNYAEGLYAREYRALFDNTGICHSNGGNGITKEDFINGYCLYAIDLTPDLCNGVHNHPQEVGNVDVFLRFTSALTETKHVLVYCTYENNIYLDYGRNPTTDFTSAQGVQG